jgi:hypothetical protein
MIMVTDSAKTLKAFLRQAPLSGFAQRMVMRVILAFLVRRGRMSCSQAAGAVATEPVHRSQITRFLARPRWQKIDYVSSLRELVLQWEVRQGTFLFLIDATLASQAGQKTQNTFSTGNRKRRPRQGRRYGKTKHAVKTCHSFTFGLLITPSGYRLPFQIPHYTKEYCRQKGIEHRTTAESAAALIRSLPLPPDAEVVVLGDTAYDADVVRQACQDRGYHWIFPVNPERVFAGPRGQRPKVRSRLKDWTSLSLQTIRLQVSTGPYAGYRRLSRWRQGPTTKPRVYYAHQETREVHSVGRVQLVFSTTQPNLGHATADNVKILMTNALDWSLRKVIELYSLRWQIELFFKELKSTLGFDQYRFERFEAVEAWVNIALAAVLYLEYRRAQQLARRGLDDESRRWWERQRLHGLREAFLQDAQRGELKYLAERLQTPGGIAKLQRLLRNAIPHEFRSAA